MSNKAKPTTPKADGKPALTPRLRFPEFRDAAGWKYVPLGTLLMRNPDYGVNAAAVPFSERLPKYLRITDISDDGTYLSDKKVSVDLEPTDEIYLDEGDIVLARTGASVGKSYRYRKEDGKLVFAGFLIRVKPDKAKLVSGYLAHFLTTVQYWDWVAVNSARSGQPGINSTEYSSLAIPLPPDDLAEQQKIAECLSSVDELMGAQARKLDALKTHRKGLMQQLFPREGETRPRLRFPEFQSAGEWSQKTVGDVSDVLMCKRIFAEDTNPNGGVPFYKIGTLGSAPDAFISKEQFEDYKSRYNFPRKGEVLITCSGTVGKCLPYDGKDAYFQDSNIVWLDNPTGEVSNAFLLMLLSSVNWGRLNSTTITRIYGPDLRGMTIKFPEAESEQQRIADCLTSLDNLIAAQAQKLAALKIHKQGLMQQLLPSPEEIEE